MALDLNYWLQPALQDQRTYGLFFLLGSFTVASLSDVRRMSAQSEFLHVWVIALIARFVVDVYLISQLQTDRFVFKWVAIAKTGPLRWGSKACDSLAISASAATSSWTVQRVSLILGSGGIWGKPTLLHKKR